jgi:flagellar biosynthesis/type III secretory pathway protein FliH
MSSAPRLEDFGPVAADNADTGPSKTYLAGFEDGVRAGQHAAAQQQDHLSKELATQIRNAEATRAEVREELLAAIAPVIEQLTRAILPELVCETFVPRLAHAIRHTVAEAAETPLVLSVCPSQQTAVAEALSSATVRVLVDPALSENQARLACTETETLIDLPALTRQLQDALVGLLPEERTSANG